MDLTNTANEVYRNLLNLRERIDVSRSETSDFGHLHVISRLSDLVDAKLAKLRNLAFEETSNPTNPAIEYGLGYIFMEPMHVFQSLEIDSATGEYRIDRGPWVSAVSSDIDGVSESFPETIDLENDELGPCADFIARLRDEFGFTVTAHRIGYPEHEFVYEVPVANGVPRFVKF